MGRTLQSSDPLATVFAPCEAAISANDLVLLQASGRLRPADTQIPLAQQNAAVGVNTIRARAVLSGAAWATGSVEPSRRTAVELGDGNIACAYHGDGTTSTTGTNVMIVSPVGARALPVIVVSSATGSRGCRVVRLGAANFCVLWLESTTLRMAVYTNGGTVVVAPFTVSALNSTDPNYFNAAFLANGDVVVAYGASATGGLRFRRYNTSGALQGSETTVEASIDARSICVLPLAAGGFWVYWYRGTATVNSKFARFDASGTLQGSVTVISGGGGSGFNGGSAPENWGVELSNGNVVLLDTTTASDVAFLLYGPTGTFVRRCLHQTGVVSEAGGVAIAAVAGFVTFSHAGNGSSGPPRLSAWTLDGLQVRGGAAVTGPTWNNPNSQSGSGVWAFDLGAGQVCCASFVYDMYDSGGAHFCSLFSVGADLTAAQTPFIANNLIGGVICIGAWFLRHSNGSVIFFGYAGQNVFPSLGIYTVQAASVLGVAQAAAAAGAQAGVTTQGSCALSRLYPGGVTDRRSASPPGPQGVVAGQSAHFFGLR